MFKLIKILNSASNVPEPVYANKTANMTCTAHCVYYVRNGKLTTDLPMNSEQKDLLFIPLETVKSSDNKTKVFGYYVTDDMIFETTVEGNPSNVQLGNGMTFHVDMSGNYSAVTDIVGIDARAIDLLNIPNDNKILVSLNY